MKENNQLIITGVFILLTSITITVGEIMWLEIPRIVLGTITLLFIPGRWMTKIFFDRKEIDTLERIAISFALSIAIVPLLAFYLNLLGVPISAWLVIGIVCIIVIASYGWYINTINIRKVTGK